MSGKRLLVATAVLAVLLGVTVWQFNAREAEDTRAPDVTVKLPKIKKDDVDELAITPPDKPGVVLKKHDKTWTLTSPLAAAADQSAVDNALSKLAELEVVGVAATKPDNYDKLEVTDKKALHVVAKQGGKPLADLLIGTYRTGNTMVRQQGATNVATVKGSIRYAFDKAVKDWRDRAVTDVTSEQVKAVEFENAHGKFAFVKDGKEWKQAPGEKPIANFESGKIVSLVGTATTLHATDFAPDTVTADAAGVGDKSDGLVILTTGGDAGEQKVLLHIGHKLSNGYYARREGKDPIFIISDWSGDRLIPSADKFVKDAPGKTVTVNPIPKPGTETASASAKTAPKKKK